MSGLDYGHLAQAHLLIGMPSLRDDLCFDHVFEYARACVEVARCLSVLHAEGRHSIVLPSRGAYPIYKTADHVREYFGSQYIPHKWMVLPFTADACQGIATAQVRAHWSNVAVAESTGIENSSWIFNREFRRSLGYESSQCPGRLGPFVVIDTAISGRAACEIIDALEIARADYHMILVVDSGGSQIRPEFRRRLSASSSRVTQIVVPRLYTEDRGLALMGMTTLLYPRSGDRDHVGSSWITLEHVPTLYWGVGAVPAMTTLTHFYSFLHAMHFYATKLVLKQQFGDDKEAVEYFLKSLIANEHLVSEESTLACCRSILGTDEIEVTSSMAVRIWS